MTDAERLARDTQTVTDLGRRARGNKESTDMAENQQLKIGQTDDGTDVYLDPNSPVVQKLMGGQYQAAANQGWNAVVPAFQTVTSYLQRDTAKTLKKDLRKQRDAIDIARSSAKAQLAAAGNDIEKVKAVVSQIIDVDGMERDAIDDTLELARLEQDQNTNFALQGGAQLVGSFMGGGQGGFGGAPVVGYQQGPNGILIPILAGAAGYFLGKDANDKDDE